MRTRRQPLYWIIAIGVLDGCVADAPSHVDRPTRGFADRVLAGPSQDTVTPFPGTMGPVRRPSPSAAGNPALLRAVRAARNTGFDRVVFEFSGQDLPGYQIGYATEPVRACGTGDAVPLAGVGRLVVRLEPAQAHDALGRVTIDERESAPGLSMVKEMKQVCDFEGQVEWALGLAARRRFRVLEASDPLRVIVDVRHRD